MSPKINPAVGPAKYRLRVQVQPRVYIHYPAPTITDAKQFRKICREKLQPPAGRLKFHLYKGDTLIKF